MYVLSARFPPKLAGYLGGEHRVLKSLIRCRRRTNTAYQYSYYEMLASSLKGRDPCLNII